MATKKTTASSAKSTSKTASAKKKSASNKRTGSKKKGGENVSAKQRRKNLERVAQSNKRKNKVSQFVPFVLFALALILAVLCILNFISRRFGGAQLEGVVGEFICRNLLFGLFGHAAFLFPALLVVCGIFWFKAEDGVTRAIKAVLSVMIVALLASMMHIFLNGWDTAGMDTNLVRLFTESADLKAGGLLGGYLGWVFCWAFKMASVVIIPFCLVLLCFVLLEITPVQVWNKIKAANARRAERARLAAQEEDDEDEDEEADDEDDEYDDEEDGNYDDDEYGGYDDRYESLDDYIDKL